MRADIVIVGGGVIGSSIAFHLAEAGAGSVVVIERDPSYAFASSALSASSIRQQFTTPLCMEMSRYGFEFLKHVVERLAVDGDAPDVGLVEQGYLYLAEQGRSQGLEAALEIQVRHDVPVAALAPDELARRFPWLHTDDLALGVLGTASEGWFDGYSLMQAFRKKARSLGVTYLHAEALGFRMKGSRIAAVETGTSLVEADIFVNAGGPRAARIAQWAGATLPVAPEKRTIFAFRCAEPPRNLPLVVDASGLYVRPEGEGFITGGPAWTAETDPEDFEPDYEQFDAFTWPTLAHRVPAFEAIRMTRAWAGHYEMSLFDHNSFIGWTPGTDNLFTAAGFSGHGMQHSPAAGRGAAERILTGEYRTIDLSALSFERLKNNTPIEELNVI